MSERDEFLKTFIEMRNSQVPNDLVDINEVGRRCNMDDLASTKIAMALEAEGILKAQGPGSTYHLTPKGRKELL
jgi:predicted transcriptional regulator